MVPNANELALDRVKTKASVENRKRFHIKLNGTRSRHQTDFETLVGERFWRSYDLKMSRIQKNRVEKRAFLMDKKTWSLGVRGL